MCKLRNLKIWLRLLAGISLILVLAGSGLVAWTTHHQRATAIRQAQDFSLSVHRMTMASLTGMMLTGTIGQRSIYLDQVRQSEEIRELRVVRGDAVVRQFGPGSEEETRADAVERQVMASKTPYFEVVAEGGGESLRAVVPVIAQANYLGKNCLTCHGVAEGTSLGVVSMRIGLDSVNRAVVEFRVGLLLAVAGLFVPVIAFIYLFVSHSVTAPIKEVTQGLRDIADGEGDLTLRLEMCGRDEISDVAAAFNQFMEKLQGVIREVQTSTVAVLQTTDDLARVSSHVALNSRQQSQDAYSMAAAVEVMTYTLDGLASQAEEVQRISGQSSAHSNDGGDIIHSAAAEMGQIIETVNASAEIIQDLGRRSDQISGIVNVIKEIADQTNLLALNAAIEAARAGEQGRGFSVVADEVRKLAERTTASTQEITAMIEKIQAGTREATRSMEGGVRRVGQGAALAQQAGEAINRIKAGVEQAVAAVDAISHSLKEQALANSENAHKVESIARLSDDNSTAFQNTAQTIDHIASLALGLKNKVSRFKT